MHISDSTTVPDHCRFFALSDPKDPDFKIICDHEHNDMCSQCKILGDVVAEIEFAIKQSDLEDDDRAELEFMLKKSLEDINLWKAHQLRGATQEKCRSDILETLDNKTVLITQDWAMKFIPRKYREGQSDWYGKRGISWHITVVLRSVNDQLESLTFVHITESGQQDSHTVTAIMQHVVSEVKKIMPHLETVYYRQDNAGCYHCANTVLSLNKISEESGVNIKRIDFSDPQGGKGCCDRKSATIKAHIRIYINEGHDVENPRQMQQAIESRGGLQGVVVYIISVHKVQESQKPQIKEEKISLLNNFEFTVAGLKIWRAYNIGPGRYISKLEFRGQAVPTECNIVGYPSDVVEFTRIKPRSRKTRVDDNDDVEHLFCCPENSCIKSFPTLAQLECHISAEKHELTAECDSYGLLDKARVSYATKLAISATDIPQKQATVTRNPCEEIMEMGWALKTAKKGDRFSSKQKAYLIMQFQNGETTGNKLDPQDVSKHMRRAKDEDGNKLFTVDDYLTPRQISGFFSREAARRRTKQTAENDEEALGAAEEEANIEILHNLVTGALSFKHPILMDDFDLCESVHKGRLVKFNLLKLQEICEFFNINTSDITQKRKAPYVRKIELFAKEQCTCFK